MKIKTLAVYSDANRNLLLDNTAVMVDALRASATIITAVANGCDYQHLVDLAQPMLGNIVVVMDGSFAQIAITRNVETDDPILSKFLEHGYHSDTNLSADPFRQIHNPLHLGHAPRAHRLQLVDQEHLRRNAAASSCPQRAVCPRPVAPVCQAQWKL